MILKSRGASSEQSFRKDLPEIQEIIAKTFPEQENNKDRVMNLYTHCLLVGLCARELAGRFPEKKRESLFPSGFELVSAAHDVGKAYPVFQEKILRSGVPEYRNNTGKGLQDADPALDKANGYHWAVSRAALMEVDPYIAEIAGRHHGVSPPSLSQTISATAERYGGRAWQQVREELIEELIAGLGTQWPTIKNDTQAAIISGVTSVADWIASGISKVNAYDDNGDTLRSIIEKKVDRAGFIQPTLVEGLSFPDVFDGFRPYELQQAFIDSIDGPGIYSIEEQMGRGKTEAALYGAYSLLERGEARGIYFALPTRLTSNRIFSRFNSFLQKIIDPHGPHSSALLLHGESWLQWAEMAEEGNPGNEWFAHKRRAILAPFAVGTIDQALMSVMNVRYGFVRTFGLACKVVILDEVHSYDSYTGRLLDVLVEELKNLDCTVIILSATLTGNRRREIMGLDKIVEHEGEYPLIISHCEHRGMESASSEVKEKKEVLLQISADEDSVFEEVLERAEGGQQVLWIENTVAEAQNRYKSIGARTAEMPVSVGLLHSRFIGKDRSEIEDAWVGTYGKEGVGEREAHGRILIGTQVLEQSLDIDADFMVSRIAPTDMLLQRIGRLWRHRKFDSSRPENAKCECIILSPSMEEVLSTPAHVFGPNGYVYAPYILARTLEVWENREIIRLPDDFRSLIEGTYTEREESELAYVKREMRKEAEKLRGLAAVGISSGGTTLPENKASTRYSEGETVDVLLLKNIEADGWRSSVDFIDGSTLILQKGRKDFVPMDERKRIALKLYPQLVTVGEHMAPRAVRREELQWLKPYMYVGNAEYHPLRIALVAADGKLIWNGMMDLNESFSLHYSSELGYQAQKKDR